MDLDVNFWKSIKQLKNPVIFVPDLLLALTMILIGLAFFKYSGMSQIMQNLAVTENFQMDLFKGLLVEKWVNLVISVVFFFVVTFILGVGADVLRFNLVKEVVNHRKPSLNGAWKSGKGMFWDVVILKVCVYLISLCVLLVIALFGGLFYLFIGDVKSVLFLSLLGILGVVLLVLMKILLIYRYPVLFLEKGRHPVAAIKESIVFARRNFAYTLILVLLLAVVLLCFTVIISPVTIGLNYVQALIAAGTLAVAFGYFANLVTTLLNLIYAMWMHLFVFNCYMQNRK